MKTTIDQAAARELELYTENTRRIYDAYTVPTIRNLTRKAKAGTYDKQRLARRGNTSQRPPQSCIARSLQGPQRGTSYLTPQPAGPLLQAWRQAIRRNTLIMDTRCKTWENILICGMETAPATLIKSTFSSPI